MPPSRSVPRALFLLSVSGIVASTIAVSASAAPGEGQSGPKSGPSMSTVVAPSGALASGLIVWTDNGAVSPSLRSRADQLVAGSIGKTRSAVGGARVLPFDRILPLAEAQEAADALTVRSDVISAEPDVLATIATASPVPRNDPLFRQQFGVWDSRSSIQPADTSLPSKGGYSVKAPYLWRATTGRSTTRVAVIDTGSTIHPELAGQMTGGYDFFTPEGTNIDRDPVSGRDSDPSDPGDWGTTNGCDGGSSASDSSWHSTHVSGIVAAKANNGQGITGIASGARVVPIRVLGPCGGSTSDVAAAIVWAAGGHVDGVPNNALPAKVINLSLSAYTSECEAIYQTAITSARSRGAVVVAAAGNESGNQLAGMGSPANCPGVIAVVATDEGGQRASYSSVGTSASSDPGYFNPRPASIAAPGGDSWYESDGYHAILSTLNDGATTPGQPSYEAYDGTSMATPAVAAGAGLLSSLGYSGSQIETALRYAVQAFPQYAGGGTYNCSAVRCGKGILDLSKVPAPYGKVTIRGTMKKGKKLSISKTWTGSPKYVYQWYRNGKRISKATRSTYKLTTSDKGKKISVKVSGKKTGFKTLSKSSASRRVSS